MLSERMQLLVHEAMIVAVCNEAEDHAKYGFVDKESRDYAKEFACELKKEFDGGLMGDR